MDRTDWESRNGSTMGEAAHGMAFDRWATAARILRRRVPVAGGRATKGWMQRPRIPAGIFQSMGLLAAILFLGQPLTPTAGPFRPAGSGMDPIPVLAYYYIWFDPGSWERAKSDLPLLGPYSSGDEQIMRQHVAWAKQVGIQGFIVSWKSTEKLNRRLEKLIKIVAEEDLKLLIIYQGLDFERRPLPTDRIAADLEHFVAAYAGHEVFDMYGLPVVIWSGTWEFSAQEIAEVAGLFRGRLLLLASERQVDSYLAIADLVDGNAYYWSSVDPDAFPGYQDKLDEMGAAIHAAKGLWIAPAAPGFDARLIEGARVVDRKNGETLRAEMNAALASSPDAVGLISWNEFSENTHIEPSRNHGMRYLELLAQLRGGVVPDVLTFDSGAPAQITLEPNIGRMISLGLLGVLILSSLFVISQRGVSRSGKG